MSHKDKTLGQIVQTEGFIYSVSRFGSSRRKAS